MNKGYAMGFISSDIKSEMMNLKNGDQMIKVRFSVACRRKTKDNTADYLNFTALGKTAETIEKYFMKGRGIFVEYHISTGSYTNKEGKKVYTQDLMVDAFEFPPVKKSEEQISNGGGNSFGEMMNPEPKQASDDGFMNVPDNIVDDLPFR